jgi:hypothetical protein
MLTCTRISGGMMLRQDWESNRRVQIERVMRRSIITLDSVKVPNGHTSVAYLQGMLLDVIDLANSGFPTQQQWQAILRLKKAIREEQGD